TLAAPGVAIDEPLFFLHDNLRTEGKQLAREDLAFLRFLLFPGFSAEPQHASRTAGLTSRGAKQQARERQPRPKSPRRQSQNSTSLSQSRCSIATAGRKCD